MMDILRNKLFEAFATASDSVYIYVCDLESDMSRWSANAVEYFNLEGEYLLHAGEIWVYYIHPDDRDIYLQDIQEVLGGKKDFHNCQYRAMNRYGNYVWLECKGHVIRDENGKPEIFAGLMTRLDGQNKYDTLTNLKTLYEFYQHDFSEGNGAVMLIGLDDFRKIVSAHGYEFGDRVLVEFAKMLMTLEDDRTQVYRTGGDEFMILRKSSDGEELHQLFHLIQKKTKLMPTLDGIKLHISMSGGLTVYPENGSTKEEILDNLEHCLEYSKRNERGEITFFSQQIADEQKRIQTIKEDLKKSIENDFKGFQLYFQPLVDNKTDRICGCECLLRWQGEKIKDSVPMEFVKLLEATGDIRTVGIWVMEQALQHQKKWEQRYPGFHVSFNVSYQQFMDEYFTERLIEYAEELKINQSNVMIELTESCNVEEPEELAVVFSRLRAAGFAIALDDFGTAYASMELLKHLPVDFIKVEHLFVKNLASEDNKVDYTIINGILSLCKELGYRSVVEGVEDESILRVVRKMNADYLQGYCFSKPVPEEEFIRLVKKYNTD